MSMNVMPAQRLTDRKRLAIIDAAIAEFLANGYAATSMDRVATRAGVSKRTVYNHFQSKDELFASILAQLWQNCERQLEHPYRADRPLREQLRAQLQLKMDMLNDAVFIDLARVAMAEMMHAPERARAMVSRLGEREESVAVWIRAAQADRRLRAVEPAFAATQLQGLVKAFAFWPQMTMGQSPLSSDMQRQVIDSAVDLFLGHYAAGEHDALAASQ